MSFVSRKVVRCDDCEHRGDLHNDGHPLPEAKYRIRDCGGCSGTGHVPAPSPVDPYALPVDYSDPYAQRRRARAGARAFPALDRKARRAYLESIRIASLMEEEPA